MKRSTSVSLLLCALAVMPPALQAQTVGADAVDNRSVPQMRFEAQDFVKLKPGENLGEVLGVAVNSKGEVAVLNHPGTATTGPLFETRRRRSSCSTAMDSSSAKSVARCMGSATGTPSATTGTTICGLLTRARTRSSNSIPAARC